MQLPTPCANCGRKEYHSYRVRDGWAYCGECVKISMPPAKSIRAEQKRNWDRDKHRVDMIQPFTYQKGKGYVENPEFAKHYPEKAKTIWHAGKTNPAIKKEHHLLDPQTREGKQNILGPTP